MVEISRNKKLLDYAGIDIIVFLQDGQNAKVQVSSLLNTCKISADTGQPAIGTLFLESCASHSVVSSICCAYVFALFPCLNLPVRSTGNCPSPRGGKQQQGEGTLPVAHHCSTGCCCCRIPVRSSNEGLGW